MPEPSLTPTAQAVAPFRDAVAVTPLGDGRFGATLGDVWTVGGKAHGGILMALLARAGIARVAAETRHAEPDPLVVSAEFVRAPDQGGVELQTDVLKLGRTASVVGVRMRQHARLVLTATVTAGRLPDAAPLHAELPPIPAVPPPDALDPAAGREGKVFRHASACSLRLDAATVPFVRGERGAPVIRGWVRPLGEEPDVLFALLAGDILPPTLFNVDSRFGWSPTVQLTALLRARPAPGWLRVESRSMTVSPPWFDEDATVVDEAGSLICQARQLALAPRVPPVERPN